MQKSNLKTNFPVSDPAAYLVGADYTLIDKNFAGRLAEVSRVHNTITKLTEGFRSGKRQADLYAQYIDYLKTKKGTVRKAAKPGTSKHEYGLAVDTSSQPLRGMTNAELAKYGLHKPISSEPWHIEPIETKNNPNWKRLAPTEVDDMTEQEVKDLLKGERDTPSAWATDAVKWAVTNKIIADDKNLDGLITKEQLAVILFRILGAKK